MASWTRNNSEDVNSYNFHVKLTPAQWTTVGPQGEIAGQDHGGELKLIPGIFEQIKNNTTYSGFVVDRRATRSFFVPMIIVKNERVPDELTSPAAIGAMSLGPQYDMFISFGTKEEAALFKMSFSGGVNVGFGGIN